jgi:hypothetical protein
MKVITITHNFPQQELKEAVVQEVRELKIHLVAIHTGQGELSQ